MKISEFKIDSTVVKFYDDFIKENSTSYIDILLTFVKDILNK